MFRTIVGAILFVEIVIPFIFYALFGEDMPGCVTLIILIIILACIFA